MNQEFYNLIDRSRWSEGPWDQELLDRKFWTDPETNYLCLIWRHQMGHWCGYVAVLPEHPAYHDQRDTDFEVHGGVTFNATSPKFILDSLLDDPLGKELSKQEELGPFRDWLLEQDIASGILDAVWIGFDCAHVDDLNPSYPLDFHQFGEYRNVEYVMAECQNLAKQLYQIEKGTAHEVDPS